MRDPRPVGANWPIGRCLLILLLVWLAFTWPWLSGSVTVPWDAKAHFYPQILFLAHALRDGDSPFWAPQIFAGHPQIADPQALIFSPFALLAVLDAEPSFAMVDGLTFAALGLGAAAIILIFADRRWHWSGAVVAALVFCFGAAAAWRIQHVGQILSLSYLPYAFLFLDRALRRRSLGYGIAAGVVAALMALDRDQVALLGAYLLVGRVVSYWVTAPRRLVAVVGSLPALVGGTVIGAAIVTLPVLMSILFGTQSNRPSIDYLGAGAGSLHPAHLLTLFNPDMFGSAGPQEEVWGPPSFFWSGTGLFVAQNAYVLYVGAVPLLLILGAGLTRGVLAERDIRLFTGATLIVLLYGLGWYTLFFRLCYAVLPGIALFRRPADAVFLIGALVGILAGYLVSALVTGRIPRAALWQRLVEIVLTLAVAGAALGLAALFERVTTKAAIPLATGAICLAAAALALLAATLLRTRRPNVASLVLVLAVAADLIWNNGPNPSTALPPAMFEALKPDTSDPVIVMLKSKIEEASDDTRRDRIELAGLGFHWPNVGLVQDLDHTLGYNPLRLGLYTAAVGAGDTIGLPDQRQFSPLFPSYRSPLANLLGLRYIVTPLPIEAVDTVLPAGAFPLIGRPGGRYLYENAAALPRVLLATGAAAANQDELLRTGDWPNIDFTRSVVLDRMPEGVGEPSPTEGSARIVSYGNTEVIIEAQAPPGGGFVVLNDVWHPWWFADVDGRPAEILRANVLFRAVRVAEGQSRVRFIFRPVAGMAEELRHRLARPR